MQWDVWNRYFVRFCAYRMAVAMSNGKIFESVEQQSEFIRDEELTREAFWKFEESFLETLYMYSVIKHLDYNETTAILFGLEELV